MLQSRPRRHGDLLELAAPTGRRQRWHPGITTTLPCPQRTTTFFSFPRVSGPDSALFATQTPAEGNVEPQLQEFFSEEETESGIVRIRSLRRDDIGDVTRLLVQTFAEALGYSGALKWLLRKEITWYLEDCLKLANNGVVLVAMLDPVENGDQDPSVETRGYLQPMFRSLPATLDQDEVSNSVPVEDMRAVPEKTISTVFRNFRMEIDDAETPLAQRETECSAMDAQNAASPSLEEKEVVLEEEGSPPLNEEGVDDPAPSREVLLGTTDLSLTASSRSFYFLINPPKNSAYISNIAVQPEFRRQGHASRLLKAVEQIVRGTSIKDIYLHLLVKDEVAGKLYRKFGYTTERISPDILRLFGQDPKYLLRKTLD